MSTGDALETLIRRSIDKQGLAIRKTAPEWRGKVRAGGAIRDGRVVAKGELDFVGHLAGQFVTFDAKSVAGTSLPLSKLQHHQVVIVKHRHAEGVKGAFFLVEFTRWIEPTYFALTWPVLQPYWNNRDNGGRQSIPRDVVASTCNRIHRTGAILDLAGAIRTLIGGTDAPATSV